MLTAFVSFINVFRHAGSFLVAMKSKTRVKKLVANPICRRCGRVFPLEGSLRKCPVCGDFNNDLNFKWWVKPRSNQRRRERRRRAQRRAVRRLGKIIDVMGPASSLDVGKVSP
jgi:tRNA(Ile2) C34 agmatinyltransferase TiaS